MNLPIFHELKSEQSTYITFSKALLDFDKARINNTEYYYTYMVALNLPNYKNPDFFIDLSEVGIIDTNPNITMPKALQYYMENIVRQASINQSKISEVSLWKTLHKMGLSYTDIQNSVTFVNKIATESFTQVENNNGWIEVVGVIPNQCKQLNLEFIENDLPNIIPATPGNLDGMFDNGNKEFLFDTPGAKNVINFENLSYSDELINTFDFNVLLFFYKDSEGVDKLHGINFINNFENKITEFELPKYTQKTNDARSIGYQFKLNLKTVNNEATKILVEQQNFDAAHWNTYLTTLNKLNDILYYQRKKSQIFE